MQVQLTPDQPETGEWGYKVVLLVPVYTMQVEEAGVHIQQPVILQVMVV